MDKLEQIFELQNALNDELARRRGLSFDYETWMEKLVLAMQDELAELLRELNYKWWKNERELNAEEIKEELVDILHFFVSMCLRSGIDANELYTAYLAKNQENFDRQNGISKKEGYIAPIG